MNISPLDIYLWQSADKLIVFSVVIAVMAAALFVATLEMPDIWTAIFAGVALVFTATAVLIPSSKTIAMMFVIPQIANSEIIQKDAPELFKSAIEAAKEALKPKP